VAARLASPLEKDKPIQFRITFLNTGREAGRDINIQIANSTIDGYNPFTTSMKYIKVPDNTTCEGLSPVKGGGYFPPSLTGAVDDYKLDSFYGEPPFSADDKIVDGDKFYLVRGCVAYVTFGSVHHSSFCYVLETSYVYEAGAQALNEQLDRLHTGQGDATFVAALSTQEIGGPEQFANMPVSRVYDTLLRKIVAVKDPQERFRLGSAIFGSIFETTSWPAVAGGTEQLDKYLRGIKGVFPFATCAHGFDID
jgi:hypothetical protein